MTFYVREAIDGHGDFGGMSVLLRAGSESDEITSEQKRTLQFVSRRLSPFLHLFPQERENMFGELATYRLECRYGSTAAGGVIGLPRKLQYFHDRIGRRLQILKNVSEK